MEQAINPALAKGRHYWPDLDGIRGFAVLGVMAHHGLYAYLPGGFLGVDVFFALSGFLITFLLYAEFEAQGHIGIGRFYMRRILRLYPALVVTITAAAILWPKAQSAIFPRAAFGALLYHTNYLHIPLNLLSHTWSLSLEEQFYLLFPPFFRLLLSRRWPVVPVFLGVALIALGARWSLFHAGVGAETLTRVTYTRADTILAGCIVGVLAFRSSAASGPQRRLHEKTAGWVGLACLLLLCVAFLAVKQDAPWLLTWGHSLIALVSAALLYCALQQTGKTVFSKFLRSAGMRYCGTRSYGLYLYHFLVFNSLEFLRRPHSMQNFVLVSMLKLGVSFAAAELSFRFIEKPFYRLKRRYEAHAVAPSQQSEAR